MPVLDFFRSIETEVGAFGSVVGSGTMLQAGRSWVRVPMKSIFSMYLLLAPALGSGVCSTSNRNAYQEHGNVSGE
jgi:hypothetical protein